ncbi:hypothetical protein DRW03_25405 [Corallococcus sp. H22C18031201]|nr:hypothetical protein DRW03_25405 [Corallococcus sp. H22C18031201]
MQRIGWMIPLLALAACKDAGSTRAVRATVTYTGFLPGCVRVLARDTATGEERSTTVVGKGTREEGGSVVVAIFPPEKWGNALEVEARAFEVSCDAKAVVQRTSPVTLTKESVPEKVTLSLAATDADHDGYVSELTGGTDCSDVDDAIHPGAAERCNGVDDDCNQLKDDNLRLGEECTGVGGCGGVRACGPQGDVVCNSPAPLLAYPDRDHDTHGAKGAVPQSFCDAIPPDFVSAVGHENDDCDDSLATTYPGAPELCDNVDNDCNGKVDETFELDTTCTPAHDCNGQWKCDPNTLGRTCAPQSPLSTWYLDDDEDTYGDDAVRQQSCTQPAHYVARGGDCNDGNPFTNPAASELCDGEDNDCSGQNEPAAICTGPSWVSTIVGPTSRTWYQISLWGDHGVWVAGLSSGRAVKSPGQATFTVLSGSCSSELYGVWADDAGTAYLGGTNGTLVTQTPSSTNCTPQQPTGVGSYVYGLVGVPSASGPVLYGAGGELETIDNGHLFTWQPPATRADGASIPNQIMYDIHAANPDTITAVGGDSTTPVIRRYDRATREWRAQSVATGNNKLLYSVFVVNERLAYAGGTSGMFLRWDGATWTRVSNTPFGSERINGIQAFGASSIYAVTEAGKIYRYNGSSWSLLHNASGKLKYIRGTSPGDLWVTGDGGRILHWPK